MLFISITPALRVCCLQVILNGSQSMHGISDRGVSVSSLGGSETLSIASLDCSLVSPGRHNPFPNGVIPPDMAEGVHFNLMNNIWGTNYIMWVPWSQRDVNMAFRFELTVTRNGPAVVSKAADDSTPGGWMKGQVLQPATVQQSVTTY